MEVIPYKTPLAALYEARREAVSDVVDQVRARSAARMDFWMETMADTNMGMLLRLRASELSAKADGDFEQHKRRVNSEPRSYIELFMKAVGGGREVAEYIAGEEFDAIPDGDDDADG